MKRVIVIGCGGAGKTILSRRLSQITGLPVIHLDQHFWKPGWIAEDSLRWKEKVKELIQLDEWIMDGNFGSTLELRYDAADTIIFLDTPRWRCFLNVFCRRLTYAGRNREELPEGCVEHLNWPFMAWIWTYKNRRRISILARLEELGKAKRVEIFHRRKEVSAYLSNLKRAQ